MHRIATRWKALAVAGGLALTFAISEKDAERLGDNYQYALPLMALACAVTNGQAQDFMVRYVVQLGLVHGPKNALGDAAINTRPNGNLKGMPSGHTATAVLGASNLVHECIKGSPIVQGAVILSAGYVGASRIEADHHNFWQVLAGALAGWLSDRAFRRLSPLGWLKRLLRRT
ncbi:MAG: phosphatase PAP2 family protein [Rhodobacteraceae bacterium]|nr:phosphatase PAP2 family protein [Paracoccaceae bacterium]